MNRLYRTVRKGNKSPSDAEIEKARGKTRPDQQFSKEVNKFHTLTARKYLSNRSPPLPPRRRSRRGQPHGLTSRLRHQLGWIILIDPSIHRDPDSPRIHSSPSLLPISISSCHRTVQLPIVALFVRRRQVKVSRGDSTAGFALFQPVES